MRNAKIVCTLGPASDDPSTIRALVDAGMSVARINASHGSRRERGEIIDRVRMVDREVDTPVSILLDLQGPEVRTTETDTPVRIDDESEVRFVTGGSVTADEIGVSVGLTGVEPGDTILLDDGRIETTVVDVSNAVVVATVDVGGMLPSRSGVNVPGVPLDIDSVTSKDRRDLELAVDHEVDFIAASFVRSGEDVFDVNKVLEESGVEIPIIAKIERADAMNHLGAIIDAAYGIMVARGDLGVECPLERVPLIQKRIIRQCQQNGVPVITATEMLDSMVKQRRPSRAEASDVANAVLDGTDAVMLSGETAIGDHPVRVVETMDRIVREVESSEEYEELVEQRVPPVNGTSTDALARSARYLARDVDASAIIVASESGYTALKSAKFRPGVPVVATTPNDRVRRQLALSWGVTAQFAALAAEGAAGVIENAVSAAVESGTVTSGDTVVVVSGMMTDLDRSTTNTLKVHVAAETIAAGRGVVTGRAAGPLVRSNTGELDGLSEGVILYLSREFDGDFSGDYGVLHGIIHERSGMTGYPAMIARELEIPMVSGVSIPETVTESSIVTVDGERGVVYQGDVTGGSTES